MGGDPDRFHCLCLVIADENYETTDIKIFDLALDIGFQNLGHFYRTFEKHFCCTPREYRLHGMALS
jgi:AraC-like DNA-binding protein